MSSALWIIQVLLAILFLFGGMREADDAAR